MKRIRSFHALVLTLTFTPGIGMASPPQRSPDRAEQKQRLIVLSDIGADPDDTESFVRLMLYSNDIDLAHRR